MPVHERSLSSPVDSSHYPQKSFTMTSQQADLPSWPYESITYRSSVLTQSDESIPNSTWLDAEEEKLVLKHASRNAEHLDGNESIVSND
jgi:hypothetical protein